jgi:sugar phosphate isomerase/epimerase
MKMLLQLPTPVKVVLTVFMLLIFAAACNESEAPNTTVPITAGNAVESPNMNIPDQYKIGEFAVGTQAYTFNRFTVFEAIEKTAAAGGRVIELYPGQTLSPDNDIAFNHEVSDDIIEEVLEKLEQHDLKVVNFGVVGLPDENVAREVFEFAQKLGVPAITSNPNTHEEMDFIEPLVQEFDIMMAIHNHPRPRDRGSDYRIWDPEHVLDLVADRDSRLGACADTGHWIRSGISPVDALRILEGRVISLHLKDVDRFEREGVDVIFGTGVGDVSGVLRELQRQNFGGHISIEYESNWYENVPDVAQNVGFIRGWQKGAGN